MGNAPVDAVTVEVVRAALNAAAERMRITMIKTAYNHIISESLDFGCAIFDPDVQMISQGIGLPVFQGHLGFPVQAAIADRGIAAFREGDVFIHNDPYTGNGNHLNDVAMFAPVYWEGQITGFVSVKAHWSDVGGPVPSSMQVGSTDFRQEGLRFRSVRLFDRGELNEEVMRIIAGNIRTESGTLKDVQAMIAVCRVGIAYFQEILGKYGRDTVLDATRVYMEQSERRTRAELARIPSGVYRAVGHFDNDGITLDRPVRDGDGHHDRRRRHARGLHRLRPQVTGPFNCGDAITVSACRLLIKCLTTPLDPVDEGCFRPLSVTIPPRSVLAAEEPAPTARHYVPINLLIDLGLRALAPAIPERIPAASYGDQMPTIAFGTHPGTGKLFIQGDLNAGGTGGRPTFDGESAMIIFGGSTARNNPVEVVESRIASMRILRHGLRQDSGGAGRLRGGARHRARVRAPRSRLHHVQPRAQGDPAVGPLGRHGRRRQRRRDHGPRRLGAPRPQSHAARHRRGRDRADHDGRRRRLRPRVGAGPRRRGPRRRRGLRVGRSRAARLRRRSRRRALICQEGGHHAGEDEPISHQGRDHGRAEPEPRDRQAGRRHHRRLDPSPRHAGAGHATRAVHPARGRRHDTPDPDVARDALSVQG